MDHRLESKINLDYPRPRSGASNRIEPDSLLGKASSHSRKYDQLIERISPRYDRCSIRVRSGLPIPARGYNPLFSRGPTRSWNSGWPVPTTPSLESGIDSIAPPPEGDKAADAACAVDGGIEPPIPSLRRKMNYEGRIACPTKVSIGNLARLKKLRRSFTIE